MLTRRERLRIEELNQKISETKTAVALLATDDATRSKLETTITELSKEKEAVSKSARRTMISAAIEPRTMRVLPRGNWLDDSGPLVTSSIPKFLGKLDTGDQRATRLDLAHWLTDAENGNGLLTARVFANRFWYLLFGEGIARNLTDFGGQGEPPSHPELLDNLAIEFVESGWNVRHMLKLIAMSRAYRQSSLASGSGSRQRSVCQRPAGSAGRRREREALPASRILPPPEFPNAEIRSARRRAAMAARVVRALATSVSASHVESLRRTPARRMHRSATSIKHSAGIADVA